MLANQGPVLLVGRPVPADVERVVLGVLFVGRVEARLKLFHAPSPAQERHVAAEADLRALVPPAHFGQDRFHVRWDRLHHVGQVVPIEGLVEAGGGGGVQAVHLLVVACFH